MMTAKMQTVMTQHSMCDQQTNSASCTPLVHITDLQLNTTTSCVCINIDLG